MFDYAGAIHFHSAYSYDARGSMEHIVQAALEAGLRYAVLTDHFKLEARADGWEKYHGPLLLIVGEEVSPRYNHYLALGLREPIVVSKDHHDAQSVIDAVKAQGGFG